MKNRVIALVLVVLFVCILGFPIAASEETAGFSDVAADAWYGQAVQYVGDSGLMSGTTATTFSPDAPTSRAMLVTTLYRRAGSPAGGAANFSDVAADSWYGSAVGWAAANGIVSGFGNGRFAPDDPVTREQLATILWRTAGSPAAGNSTFADGADIGQFARQGVAWVQEQGIVGGKSGNLFAPQGSATRAELAVMLHRWLGNGTPPQPEAPGGQPKTLVAYFSCTGATQAIAETLAQHVGADLYAITPAQPYTTADLNYNDSSSRGAKEQSDQTARPALGGSVVNLNDYDTIYLGYPIWFGQAPKIIATFLESQSFAGKTIIPFCTSGSSGMGNSAEQLHSLVPGATWTAGQRFDRDSSQAVIAQWVDRLGPAPSTRPPDQGGQTATAKTLTIQVGTTAFTAMLQDNDTARAFVEQLPMTVTMGELNGNEKFYYLPKSLPADSRRPGTLRTGDLMLYGSDCLVLFYETFSSSYSYTPIGNMEDPAGLAAALGSGSVQVTFTAN